MSEVKLALSYDEAAAALGVSKKVLQIAVRNNELVASYPNSKPIFRLSELQRWLDSLPNERPQL
jgi:hypothetical protein